MSGVDRIARTDGRRLRALLVKALEEEASAGHSFVERDDLAARVTDTDDDPAELQDAVLDDARWRQNRELFADKLAFEQVDGVDAVFLKTLRDDESRIRASSLSA
jgi:hypothetical protein